MSPRAAWRLESLGFTRVYDYVPGKADWGSAGLPLEGASGSATRVGAHLRRDAPTCRLDERVGEVRARLAHTGFDTCLVVSAGGVVLGRLGRRALAGDPQATAEQAMTAGPGTVRPSARLDATRKRLRERDLTSLPVTTSDGRLVGLLLADDAEAAAAASAAGAPGTARADA